MSRQHITIGIAALLGLSIVLFIIPRIMSSMKGTTEVPQTPDLQIEEIPMDTQSNTSAAETNTAPTAQTIVAGLTGTDTVVGTGAEAKPGDKVTVSYVGKLADGTVFDASANHGGSFSFQLGTGYVIKGWDLGVQGMKVGGKRTLVIAPELGYGSRDLGSIPPNSTLTFDVELLGVESAPQSL